MVNIASAKKIFIYFFVELNVEIEITPEKRKQEKWECMTKVDCLSRFAQVCLCDMGGLY